MPVETGRVTRNKQITLPSGAVVLVPVICEITFADPVRRGQEATFTIDNTASGDRRVRIKSIMNESGADRLEVERVQLWQYIDPVRRGATLGRAMVGRRR